MSSVTNVILSVEIGTSIFVVNEHLKIRFKGVLTKVDHHCGGNKEMEVDLYIGAFNHLNFEGLMLISERLEGTYTLMAQDQHESNFQIIGKREI